MGGGPMGAKVSDLFGAYGCHACHDYVDGRYSTLESPILIRAYFVDGVLRTQQILLDEGLITIT
jgi:hypothetical protein